MLFRDESAAHHFLENISYYRLKGYWWDMQDDYTQHTLKPNTYFEDILDRYTFDRNLLNAVFFRQYGVLRLCHVLRDFFAGSEG